MTDRLEMSLEQFAEAVAKENVRLNEHNEKLKGQTKLYFDAFNKATDRIQELEAALRTIYECCDETGNCSVVRRIARKALEGKDE